MIKHRSWHAVRSWQNVDECARNFGSRGSGAPLWAALFPSSSWFSIVNEEDRRERGLLVLIYPGGSLGITINSQLRAHSIGRHRHCQFVPIREASLWVSAVRGCSGPTGEQRAGAWPGPDRCAHTAPALLPVSPDLTSYHAAYNIKYAPASFWKLKGLDRL